MYSLFSLWNKFHTHSASPPPATTASRNSIPDDDDLFGQLLIHTEPPEAASEGEGNGK